MNTLTTLLLDRGAALGKDLATSLIRFAIEAAVQSLRRRAPS